MCSAPELLAALTDLVLQREDPAPTLVGVDTSEPTLRLHVVPLHLDDPLTDLQGLALPAVWDLLVVRVAAWARRVDGTIADMQLAHGRNRWGDEVTRARSDGHAQTLHVACGPLQHACEQLLAEVGPRRSMGGRRS